MFCGVNRRGRIGIRQLVSLIVGSIIFFASFVVSLSLGIAPAYATGNLLSNAGFESALVNSECTTETSYSYDNWTTYGDSCPTLATSPVHSGSYSGHVHTLADSSGGYFYQDVPESGSGSLPEDTSFTFSAWVYPVTNSEQLEVGFDWDRTYGDDVGDADIFVSPTSTEFTSWGSEGTAPPLTYDTWSELTLVVNASGETYLLVDGNMVGKVATGSMSSYSDATVFVGQTDGTNPVADEFYYDDISLEVGTSNPSVPDVPASAVGVGTGQSSSTSDGDGSADNGSAGVARHNTTCVRADPVNCASGDFTETETDGSVPGRGPELDLTRSYNSLEASTEGMFGYGWSSSYEMSLVTNEDESVTITAGDGSQVTAEPSDDTYVMPSWSDSTLTANEGGTWTYLRDQTETYTFSSSGQLTEISDPNGYEETLSYTSGKLTTVTDASGRTLTFEYGENGLVSEVTDPAGQHTTYGYDDSDELTSVTDPMERVTSFTYGDSGDHLLLTIKYPNDQSGGPDAGDHLTNTYNDSDQVLTQTDPQGLETTFSYSGDNFSSSGGATTITDPHGNVEVEYYIGGTLVADTKGHGTSSSQTWTYSYDASTLGETSITDPNGNTTTSTYDEYGNLLTSTDALGNTTTYTYNSLNEPLTVTDPMGIETEYTYDDDGNMLTKTVIGSGESLPEDETTYSYGDDHLGDVTSVTDPDSDVTDYTYDSYGDVVSETTNPGSSTISYVQSGATNTDDGSIDSGSSADILPDDPTPGDALVALIYTFSGNDDDVTAVTGMGGSWHRGATMTNDDANDESGDRGLVCARCRRRVQVADRERRVGRLAGMGS